jgi:hypothetical protein
MATLLNNQKIDVLDKINPQTVKNYGITEAFILDGELYTTSNYDLGPELFNQLEKSLTDEA